mgnify:CR=1 FL=1
MNKRRWFIVVAFFIIIIVTQSYIKGFYSYDTIKIYKMGYMQYAKKLFFADGRVFSGIFLLIGNLLNIQPINLYIISCILQIIILIITMLYFADSISPICKNKKKITLYIISFITIFNFTNVDILQYVETSILQLSILMYMMSAKYAIIDKNKKKMLVTLIIATFLYQGTINVFFMMLIFYGLLRDKKLNKNLIKEEIKILLYAIIPITINYIYVKIYGKFCFTTNRIEKITFQTIFDNFIYSIRSIRKITYENIFTLPKNMYIFLILCLIIYSFILCLIKNKSNEKENTNINVFYNIIIMVVASIVISIPVTILFPVQLLSICGRMYWPIGAIFGLIYMELYLNSKYLHKPMLMILAFIYLITLFTGMYNIYSLNREANNIDKRICKEIQNRIDSYEQENENKIDKIKIYRELIIDGGISEKNVQTKMQKSFVCVFLPMEDLIEMYCNIDRNKVENINYKIIEFENDFDFYFDKDIVYVYIGI